MVPATVSAKNNTLTRSEVAELFGVSPHTVTRWANEGRLPAVKTLGGQRRYSKETIYQLASKMRDNILPATSPSADSR